MGSSKRAKIMKDREQRSFKAAEMRVEGDEKPSIRGYAAVFNVISEAIDWFREIIRPGAFSKTINDGADVRALFNHDPNFVIARTKSGTLKLKEDDKGLFVEIVPPDTTWARDLITSIRRGDVSQMSFGFETVKDRWGTEEGERMRELLEVKLFDVSPVTYPAYPQTSVSARSILTGQGIEFDAIAGILFRAKHGGEVNKIDHEIIIRSIEILKQFLPKSEPVESHSDGKNGNGAQVRNHDRFRRRLELAERELHNYKHYFGGQ